MAITSAGIGSGLDIESLVSQLVSAEGQPAVSRLANKEARLTTDISAFGTLRAALSTFQTAVKNLSDPASFLGRKTTSSNSDLFTASATTSAVAGSYQIEVEQLAKSAKASSAAGQFSASTDVVGTGTLDISLGGESFSVLIEGTNNTLEGIRDAINTASDNPGVTATIINTDSGTSLVLSSEDVGSANAISVVATDDDGLDGFDLGRLNALEANPESQAAQDAIIYVDNQRVTRSSNSFSDVIDGVTFDLANSEPGTIATLTVAQDQASVKSKVQSFIGAYNDLTKVMDQLSAYNADTGRGGPLLGDSALRGVESQIRNTIVSAVDGLDFATLAEIGVTTNESNQLELDGDTFDAVVASDFSSISELFASENGLASRLDSVLESYAGAGGIIEARTQGLNASIESLEDDRERLGNRLEALEARYRAQFTAMDVLVGQLSSIGNFLSQQLANIPQPGSINNKA